MVGERDGQVGGELVGDLLRHDVSELGGKLQHIGIHLVDKRQVLAVDAVKRPLDVLQIDLVRHIAKPNAAPQRNELVPGAVLADGGVMVDALNGTHGRSSRLVHFRIPPPPMQRKVAVPAACSVEYQNGIDVITVNVNLCRA